MFNTLIESKKRKELNRGEVVLSVLAHVLLVGLAVYVTTRVEHFDIISPDKPVLITYIAPTPVVEPVTQIQKPITKPTITTRATSQPVVQTPTEVPSTIPAIDPNTPITHEDEYTGDLPAGIPNGSPVARDTNAPYYADQVTRQASLRGQLRLTYPSSLERERLSGRVVLQFVIEVNGKVRPETIKVIESTHSLFSVAAEAAVLGARFNPAQIGLTKVRQLVQLPITFQVR